VLVFRRRRFNACNPGCELIIQFVKCPTPAAFQRGIFDSNVDAPVEFRNPQPVGVPVVEAIAKCIMSLPQHDRAPCDFE
jgi:hypothetical protein